MGICIIHRYRLYDSALHLTRNDLCLICDKIIVPYFEQQQYAHLVAPYAIITSQAHTFGTARGVIESVENNTEHSQAWKSSTPGRSQSSKHVVVATN